MKSVYVIALAFIFSSVTILTTLAIWETNNVAETASENEDHSHELFQLTQEQLRITKLVEELNAKIQGCESTTKTKAEEENKQIISPIITNTQQPTEENGKAEILDFVANNHGHYLENLHRVQEFNPPVRVNYTHGIEEVSFYFLQLISNTYANLSIKEISRMDVALQDKLEIGPFGLSCTINAVVTALHDSVAICSSCQAMITITTPLFFNENVPASSVKVGKVEAHVYDPTVRVNFVSSNFNVTSLLQRQSEYMRSVWAVDKHIRWVIAEYENEEDPEGTAKVLAALPFPTVHKILPGAFSRVDGLNAAADMVENSGEILFFLDVDMYFSSTFSQAIRSRVIEGKQVFYPVSYSFNENGSPPETKNGFYREGGLGNMGMYKSDHEKNRWYKNGDATKWGNEDNIMFAELAYKSYKSFRTYEPSFFHIYHPPRSWKNNK